MRKFEYLICDDLKGLVWFKMGEDGWELKAVIGAQWNHQPARYVFMREKIEQVNVDVEPDDRIISDYTGIRNNPLWPTDEGSAP